MPLWKKSLNLIKVLKKKNKSFNKSFEKISFEKTSYMKKNLFIFGRNKAKNEIKI